MRTTGSPATGVTLEGQEVSASSNAVAIFVWPDFVGAETVARAYEVNGTQGAEHVRNRRAVLATD